MPELKTRLTDLLHTRYPIIQAGMVWCSGSALASAVSNAGGLGVLGSGSMYPEQLREEIARVRAATKAPFAVNIPLMYKHANDMAQVVLEEKVPVVITSAGNPKTFTAAFKANGSIVLHVVSSAAFAQKSEAAGCDAVIAEGFEAGGHNGREETTTLCLIPLVRSAVSIPVIAAGGIATGSAIAAVLALGADGVQVGTRFVASEEAYCHIDFKQKVTTIGEGDTILTLKEIGPVRLIKNGLFQKIETAYRNGASSENLRTIMEKGLARRGMLEGDLENGELEIGQASALVHDILPAHKIVENLMLETHAAFARLKRYES